MGERREQCRAEDERSLNVNSSQCILHTLFMEPTGLCDILCDPAMKTDAAPGPLQGGDMRAPPCVRTTSTKKPRGTVLSPASRRMRNVVTPTASGRRWLQPAGGAGPAGAAAFRAEPAPLSAVGRGLADAASSCSGSSRSLLPRARR